ncbi:Tetratricopeptide repeat-containing domain [Macleaya cordata]|uniref:Tetratricopeptide repeat-containing domain n=1 Tax=Macleaya cordata TaxID=56857 RepID=A0A200PZ97_MACCD|nr:Tetratricopeptide repeat-containing domain [Macleaya cordata]
METLAKINHYQNPLHLSLHHRPSFSKPISSFSLKPPSKTNIILRATSSSSLSTNPQNNSNKFHFETLKPLSSLLKTTCIAIVTTSLFFCRFNKPSFASPVPQPTVESTEDTNETKADEENEKTVEDYFDSIPDDVEGLKSLMEAKIKDKKIEEAISILDKLIQLDPSEKEWSLLKSHLQSSIGESEMAKLGFEEILSKDPLSVEAYHGLVMAASQSDSGELGDVLKRINKAMERCKVEKNKEELRDFKLLVAQVRVIEGKYSDALKVYQELVKEEPRDFRPYLCQGIIYTLLRKKDEADKQFQKYRRLVPKEHPYARYFEDNMMATKVFSQMAENQMASSKS